ncbi:MAG: DNA N-6-adenine-methyltransferase, partial [Chthoniobacteraceae bacterium]
YTPPAIIEAARLVLGTIDLDPASSAAANKRVEAIRIFTEADDGLAQQWHGKVWLNHPFGKKLNAKWINKLEEEFESGRVQEALCITYACTSEKWFQPLLQRPQCFLCPRTNYHLPDGSVKKGVTKGSVVTYFGANVPGFAEAFASLGVVKI